MKIYWLLIISFLMTVSCAIYDKNDLTNKIVCKSFESLIKEISSQTKNPFFVYYYSENDEDCKYILWESNNSIHIMKSDYKSNFIPFSDLKYDYDSIELKFKSSLNYFKDSVFDLTISKYNLSIQDSIICDDCHVSSETIKVIHRDKNVFYYKNQNYRDIKLRNWNDQILDNLKYLNSKFKWLLIDTNNKIYYPLTKK
jgi:hypothetical protein